jgi:hypothetical protein
MFSRLSFTRSSGASCLCLLGALFLLAAGCGKKGDPMPPVRVIPAPVKDLELHQQGTDFILRFSYPKTTVSGGPLPGVNRIELLAATFPAPAAGFPAEVEPRRFAAAAEVRRLLNPADLSAATSGDRVFLRLPVPQEDDGTWAYYFGVRTLASNGEISGLSNVAGMVPGTPPEPPGDLALVPGPDGLVVKWKAPEGTVEGFYVYRRDARSRAYTQPGRPVGAGETELMDEGARYGQRYIYTVTTVSQRDPLVESRLSAEAEVFYQDRFAAEPPGPLVALPEAGQVRLQWEPSPSRDATSYHVYRREGADGDFRRLTGVSTGERSYLDVTVRSGRVYTYRITALDSLGNEGDPGQEITITVR